MSKIKVTLFCCLVMGVLASAASADVLIAASPGTFPAWAQDVADKIAATGKVPGDIDLFNTRTGTPTPEQLAGYDAVMTFTDGGSQNADLLGDRLADYVDGGGGVVQCVFSWHNSIPLAGRWRSGGYSPLTYNTQAQGVRLQIGTRHDPGHPVLDDVDTFNGGSASYHNTVDYAPNAVEIADWSNNRPLVAEMPGKNTPIIGLNFYPPSSTVRQDFWDASTDGAELLANALAYAMGGGGGKCNYTIKKSKAKKGCDSCPPKGEGYQSEAKCEVKGDCRKKVKTTINCPQGEGTCKIKAKKRQCG